MWYLSTGAGLNFLTYIAADVGEKWLTHHPFNRCITVQVQGKDKHRDTCISLPYLVFQIMKWNKTTKKGKEQPAWVCTDPLTFQIRLTNTSVRVDTDLHLLTKGFLGYVRRNKWQKIDGGYTHFVCCKINKPCHSKSSMINVMTSWAWIK